MTDVFELATVAGLGLATTSSSIVGAAVGLYGRLPPKLLASVLGFAAGSLISALAIELGFENAQALRHGGLGTDAAWLFVGGGFALGACVYYSATLVLEGRGAAIRLPTRFREYAVAHKRQDALQIVALLSQCDLLRHLPPEAMEEILPCIRSRRLEAGEVLFRAGDPGDALYIVSEGRVEVLTEPADDRQDVSKPIATLGPGQAFGEMALLTSDVRTATVRAASSTELLAIGKDEFEHLMGVDRSLAVAVQRLSQERAISNLGAGTGGPDPSTWARVASRSLEGLTRHESDALLSQAGRGAGLAIVLGNILDTIPGCLVIGAKFAGPEAMSLTLIGGMFLGGIPEAAASASMLRKAGFRPSSIFGLWSTVLVAGMVAAVAGSLFLGSPDSLAAIFCQAVAGGAVLALVAHAMLPEAIHQGGSVTVLPTVAGFLFGLYLTLVGAPG